MNPVGAGRRAIGRRRQARLDETQNRHSGRYIAPAVPRIEGQSPARLWLRQRPPSRAASAVARLPNVNPIERDAICRVFDTETNYAARRFIDGLPPMLEPRSRDPACAGLRQAASPFLEESEQNLAPLPGGAFVCCGCALCNRLWYYVCGFTGWPPCGAVQQPLRRTSQPASPPSVGCPAVTQRRPLVRLIWRQWTAPLSPQ